MGKSTLNNFKEKSTIFLIIGIFIETLFFFSVENIIASFVLLYGWYLIKTIVLTYKNMILYPVSFLMILGWGIFHFLMPIPLTLLEMKPVTFNMDVPLLTFIHQFLFVSVIVFTHRIYTQSFKTGNFFRRVLSKTTFYNIPTNRQIWITSILALLSSYYLYFIFGVWQSDVSERTPLTHIANILSTFIWMPLIILFPRFRNAQYLTSDKKYVLLYSILVVIIGIASNVRTLLLSGVVIFILMYCVGVLYGYYNIKKLLTPKKIIISLVVIYMISGVIIDIGYAMVYVRQDKYNISTSAFLSKTIDVFQNKQMLEKIKKIDVGGKMDSKYLFVRWDEHYLDNSVLNRFCNLKISDACLFHATNIGYANTNMQTDFLYQIAAFSPNIALNLFGISYAKKLEASSYSMTDYLYSLSSHEITAKGSFIIGSIPGLGMAIFSYWYLAVIIPLFLVIFAMFDSFVRLKHGVLEYSYLFYTMLISIINYFNDRHVFMYEFRFVLRTYIETVITFLIIMRIVRFIDSIMKAKI